MNLENVNEKNGLIVSGKFYSIPFDELMGDFVQLLSDNLGRHFDATKFDPDNENYTTSEVAKKVKKANSTITRHCQKGILKAHKVGKSWLIPKDEYQKYISTF